MLNIGNLNMQVKDLSEEEYKDEIKPLLQQVLDKEFPENAKKRKIKVYPDRLNFACPLCGDSAHDSDKKRGNIGIRGQFRGLYKCYNCEATMSVAKFFSRYKDIKLSIDAQNYYNHNFKDASYISSRANEVTDMLFDTDKINELSIDREHFKMILNLSECNNPADNHNGRNYLINRGQYNFNKFLYSKSKNELYILNLTSKGKIFGMQIRQLSNKPGGQKYMSYNITKIRQMIGMQETEDSMEFDQLSLIFNALLINYDKPIIATEGPMDAFLLPNAIAMCGGGKKIPLNFKIYYMFDGDKPGINFAIEKLKEGSPVFMWDKFLKDNNLPNKQKWDWNDVILYSRKNGFKIPTLSQYFTDNKLDMFYL